MITVLRFVDRVCGLGFGVCLGAVTMMPMAHANDYDWMLGVLNNTHIGGGVGAGASGNVAINTAAGDSNMQSNQRQIQLGAGGAASANVPMTRGVRPQQPGDSGAMIAQSEISGQAFNHADGVVGINQVSGAGNAQVNSMSMGGISRRPSEGIRSVGPAMPTQPANTAGQKSDRPVGSISDRYRAVISEGALSGISGVLQINQVSGIGNVTANHFSISMP